MTDPLSTIRKTLEWQRFYSRNGHVNREVKAALAACDALEAERLTPEEARWLLQRWGIPPEIKAKLGRRASDV